MYSTNFGMLDLAFAAAAGGGVGFLSGLFGIGGGFLLVPVLNIVLKVPIEFAIGAGACQVLGPSTTSLLARDLERRQLRLPLIITGGLFVGVFCGARVLQIAKQHGDVSLAAKTVPLAELIVMSIYLVLLLVLGLSALWEVRARNSGRSIRRGLIADMRIPPYAEFPEFAGPMSVPILAWFGLVIGFFAGLLGMSGGLILLPGLIYLLGLKTHESVTSSLIIVWIVAVQSTVVHAWHDNIDIALVMALLFGGTIGARLGSELSEKLGGRQLRQRFGWLLLFTALLIAARLVRLMLP